MAQSGYCDITSVEDAQVFAEVYTRALALGVDCEFLGTFLKSYLDKKSIHDAVLDAQIEWDV